MTYDLVKTKKGYFPAAESDKQAQSSVKYGEIVRAKTVDQRNYLFHKKFFAMIAFAFHHLPEQYDGSFTDEDDLREELLKAIGWKRTYTNFKGEKETRAKSISYDSVGQKRFETIYSRVLDVVARLVKCDKQHVLDELINFM